MKKLILAAGFSVFGFVAAHAQSVQSTTTTPTPVATRPAMQNMDPDRMAEMRTTRMDRMVKLTDDQKKQLHHVYLDEAKSNAGKPMDRSRLMQLSDKEKTILTPDQQKQFQTTVDQKKQAMMQRRANMQNANGAATPASQPASK